MALTIDSIPYRWPYDGSLARDDTALIIIDMQIDFCGEGGYVDQMGYDISLTRACIEPIGRVLAAARELGFAIIHTREGHRQCVRNLILTGITTDVCVHTTMREANDRGFECVILSDCCAATDPNNHAAALHMVTMPGGVFGAVATSGALLSGLAGVERA